MRQKRDVLVDSAPESIIDPKKPANTRRYVAALACVLAASLGLGCSEDKAEPRLGPGPGPLPRKTSGPLFDTVNILIATGSPNPEVVKQNVALGLEGLRREIGAAAVLDIRLWGPFDESAYLDNLPVPADCSEIGASKVYEEYLKGFVQRVEQANPGVDFSQNPNDLTVVSAHLPTVCFRQPSVAPRAVPPNQIIFLNNKITPSVVAHEAGHVKKLAHAYFISRKDDGSLEIRHPDSSGLMGMGGLNGPDPLNALDLVRLGVLYDNDIADANRPGEYSIEPLDADGQPVKVLRVALPKALDNPLLAAIRSFLGNDDLTYYLQYGINLKGGGFVAAYVTTSDEKLTDEGLHEPSVIVSSGDFGFLGLEAELIDAKTARVTVHQPAA